MNKNIFLKGRDFLTLKDYSYEEIYFLLDFSEFLKKKFRKGESHELLKGKTLGLLFDKHSTRTRVSFEAGMFHLGGYSLFLSSNDLQIKRGESIKDTARVLSSYLDGIIIRTYSHKNVEELAKYSEVPIINGLTNSLHPCQILADLQTIREYKGKNLKGLKLTYIGDGNNVANSLLIGCSKMGIEICVACPKDYQPKKKWINIAKNIAKKRNSNILITENIDDAVKNADVLYTDVWTSMGNELEQKERKQKLKKYQINKNLLKKASKDVIIMHCLPAHRGEEITEDVIEGKHSVVFEEAENRLHSQKAILANIL